MKTATYRGNSIWNEYKDFTNTMLSYKDDIICIFMFE